MYELLIALALAGPLLYIAVYWFNAEQTRRRRLYEQETVVRFRLEQPSPWRGKRFLVLVNPHSGRNLGAHICSAIVRPLLDKAEIEYDVVETKAGGSVRLLAEIDLAPYAAVLTVSGDGLVHEVVNGLAARVPLPKGGLQALRSPEAARAYLDQLRRVFQSLPIAVVPGGTGNGLASSLHSPDYLEAMLRIVSSEPRPADMLFISKHDVWGLVPSGPEETKVVPPSEAAFPLLVADPLLASTFLAAEHDQLQEREARWLGTFLRSIIAPLVVILRNRRYQARIRLLPAPQSKGDIINGYYSSPERLQSLDCGAQSGPAKMADTLFGPGELAWRESASKFVFFCAACMPFLSWNLLVAPAKRLNEGAFDLVLTRDVGRLATLRLFSGIDRGLHVRDPCCEYYKVRALRLSLEDPAIGSMPISCSGELAPFGDSKDLYLVAQSDMARFI